jgi:hypothetical protein
VGSGVRIRNEARTGMEVITIWIHVADIHYSQLIPLAPSLSALHSFFSLCRRNSLKNVIFVALENLIKSMLNKQYSEKNKVYS